MKLLLKLLSHFELQTSNSLTVLHKATPFHTASERHFVPSREQQTLLVPAGALLALLGKSLRPSLTTIAWLMQVVLKKPLEERWRRKMRKMKLLCYIIFPLSSVLHECEKK